MNYLSKYMMIACITGVILSGCYKEEHFHFPGPYDDEVIVPDSLPFPFDKNREAGVWLMKDGVPDYSRVLFKGYTDYYDMGDTVSWIDTDEGKRLIRHYNYYPLTNQDHFAGDANCFRYNWVYPKYMVPIGKGKSFYMYAKVAFGTFSGTAAGIKLGTSWASGGDFFFGLDGAGTSTSGEPKFFIDIYNTTVTVNPELGWPTVTQLLIPAILAEYEVVIHDELFYAKINGELVFKFQLPHEEIMFYPPQIRPWRNFMSVSDFYLESNEMYHPDFAMHEYEEGYNRIQAPALAKTGNGDLLLFAEGRSNPTSAAERIAQNTIPTGDCDIIMKRSSDGGITWSEIKVMAGEGSSVTYCYPQTITMQDRVILLYSTITGSFVNGSHSYDPNSQRIFQIESTDNGHAWSTPKEITTALISPADGHLVGGSGHGIELESQPWEGRLVVPLSYGTNAVKVAISDDKGQTWSVTDKISGNNLILGSIVELSDGSLMMVLGHNNTTPRNKLVSYSSDGGETWSTATSISTSVSTGDYGQFYQGITVKTRDGEVIIVNSTGRESDAEVKNSPVYPVTPVLFSSIDYGQTYSSTPLFTQTAFRGYAYPFGLMDAVTLNDGTVVIAGEGGLESPKEGIIIYRK